MTDLPEISLDQFELGQDMGVLEKLFTSKEVAAYADSLQDESPWYRPGAKGEPVRVHPIMLADEYSTMILNRFTAPELVLVNTDQEYLAPIWSGRRLRSHGVVTDKGLQNGREFVEIETWTFDEDGARLARMRSKVLLSMEKKA